MWNFSQVSGLPWPGIIMGHKGPVLRPRCIGTAARTHILIYKSYPFRSVCFLLVFLCRWFRPVFGHSVLKFKTTLDTQMKRWSKSISSFLCRWLVKITGFWDVTPCSLVEAHRRFAASIALRLQRHPKLRQISTKLQDMTSQVTVICTRTNRHFVSSCVWAGNTLHSCFRIIVTPLVPTHHNIKVLGGVEVKLHAFWTLDFTDLTLRSLN